MQRVKFRIVTDLGTYRKSSGTVDGIGARYRDGTISTAGHPFVEDNKPIKLKDFEALRLVQLPPPGQSDQQYCYGFDDATLGIPTDPEQVSDYQHVETAMAAHYKHSYLKNAAGPAEKADHSMNQAIFTGLLGMGVVVVAIFGFAVIAKLA